MTGRPTQFLRGGKPARRAFHPSRRRLSLEPLEARLVPSTIPLYVNAPADVVAQGVFIAITGKEPPADGGEYLKFGSPNTWTLLTTQSSIPLQKLTFQSGPAPASDSLPAGYSWAEVDLPGGVNVDSGQIILFVGANAPASLPVTNQLVTAPSPTTYPNNIFDLVEFTITGSTTYVDISNVDDISAPITLQTNPASTDSVLQNGVGIQLSFKDVVSQYQSFLTNLAANGSPGASAFTDLVVYSTDPASGGAPTMIQAPNHEVDAASLTGPTLSGAQPGGVLQPSTAYLYAVTAVLGNGQETTISAPGSGYGQGVAAFATGTQASNDLSIALGWSPVAGAVKYNLYRYQGTSSTPPTQQPANSQFGLLASVPASETSFLDQGGATPNMSINPPAPQPAPALALTGKAVYEPDGTLPYFPVSNTTYYYQIAEVNAQGQIVLDPTVQPVTVPLTATPLNAIQLSWTPAANAAGYILYRSTTSAGSGYTYLTYVASPGTSYVDDGGAQPPASTYPVAAPTAPTSQAFASGSLAAGTYYYVYTGIDPTSGLESLPSATTSQTVAAGGNIQVQWTDASTQYYVYRSTTPNGPYTLLGSTSAKVYNDTGVNPNANSSVIPPGNPASAPGTPSLSVGSPGGNLQSGNTYYYEITAITPSGQSLASSSVNMSLTGGYANVTSINANWTPYAGATGYKVYRSTTGAAGSYYLMATLNGTANTFADTGILQPNGPVPVLALSPLVADPVTVPATSGTGLANGTYYYTITAVNSSGIESRSSPNPVSLTIATSGNWISLSWPAFPHAASYNIYRSTSASGPYTLYDSTTTASYTDKGTGTASAQTPPFNSYGYDPLSSYFTNDLVQFFENYTATNSFTIWRDGYVFQGNTKLLNNTYVVLELTSTAGTVDIYAPFFTSNYKGSNPFAGSSVSWLQSYVVPAAPTWMTDSALMPGSMVFGGNGSFNTGVDDPNALKITAPNGSILNATSDIENSIDTAFNRGLAVAAAGGQAAIPANNWIDAPLTISAAPTTGGNLSSSATYYYLITTANALGESPAGSELAAVMSTVSGADAVKLTWQAPDPATYPSTQAPTGYKIYRATSQTGPWTLVTTTASSATTYLDTGGGSRQTPPVYYPSGSSANYYAAFLHQSSTLLPSNANKGVTINGLAYGFAYDDQGGHSSTIAVPTPLTALQINFFGLTKSTFPPAGLALPLPGPAPAPTGDPLLAVAIGLTGGGNNLIVSELVGGGITIVIPSSPPAAGPAAAPVAPRETPPSAGITTAVPGHHSGDGRNVAGDGPDETQPKLPAPKLPPPEEPAPMSDPATDAALPAAPLVEEGWAPIVDRHKSACMPIDLGKGVPQLWDDEHKESRTATLPQIENSIAACALALLALYLGPQDPEDRGAGAKAGTPTHATI